MNIKWLIIGVYMPYDNNKIDNFSEFETNLAIISELIKSYKRMGDYNIVIGGDFNADLNRNKKFDKNLVKFVKTEKLFICKNLNPHDIEYTYFSNNYTARLDHIFILNTNDFTNNNLSKIFSTISEDDINCSDHHPVSIEIDFSNILSKENDIITNFENNIIQKDKNFIKSYPDLDNVEIKAIFEKKVEILLQEKMSRKTPSDDEISINNTYININMAIKEAYESLITFKTKFYKTNEWWSNELKDIKNEILTLKKKFKRFRSDTVVGEDANRLKDLRKLFRVQQRTNMRNKDLKKYKFIEELTRDKSKNNKKFWYEVKKFNNNQNLNKINISMDLLENHFKKIFNEEETTFSEFQLKIKEEVNQYGNNINLQDEINIEISDAEIDSAIKEMKNSKAIGLDEICPFWLKKSNSRTMRYYLLKLINNIYKEGIFPSEFNLCKLRPIIKNFHNASDDVNNIRPISISSSIAQLLERIILNRNYKNFETNKNQFGFKKKCSCKLALFCIKETIIEYIEKQSECYMISLDAEKAFDKLWRDGLFYKLIKKLEKREWLILKRYYNISEAKIVCNNEYSNQFKIVTGVKQGGILSPFLFNMFIDELLECILNMNIGAKIGNMNINLIFFFFFF